MLTRSFFHDTATTEIYTLSLHDALPIYLARHVPSANLIAVADTRADVAETFAREYGIRKWYQNHHDQKSDRKSTRLNSSHANISYAVFCLKKKNKMHVDREQELQQRPVP